MSFPCRSAVFCYLCLNLVHLLGAFLETGSIINSIKNIIIIIFLMLAMTTLMRFDMRSNVAFFASSLVIMLRFFILFISSDSTHRRRQPLVICVCAHCCFSSYFFLNFTFHFYFVSKLIINCHLILLLMLINVMPMLFGQFKLSSTLLPSSVNICCTGRATSPAACVLS